VQAMSERATQALFSRLDGRAVPRKTEPVFDTRLVVRASTARPMPSARVTSSPARKRAIPQEGGAP